MKIAFLIYDDITLLDFAGLYDPVTRLKTMGFRDDIEYEVCARKDTIKSVEGMTLIPDQITTDLSAYEYILIPGGSGIQDCVQNPDYLKWISTARPDATIASVCGGVFLPAAAGFLKDKKATTHPGLQKALVHFAGEVKTNRVVEDGRIITAGGVTAAIDLGLFVVEKIAGQKVREEIQEQMDYQSYTL